MEVSDSGRAPKNDPAVFALAMAAGLGHAGLAMEALPKVCRIGTHLFQFAEAVQEFRGWGKRLRKGIASWYDRRQAEDLAHQVAKYQRRDGWSHRDLLRLAHPRSEDPAHQAVYRWVVGGLESLGAREVRRGDRDAPTVVPYPDVTAHLPAILSAMEAAKAATTAAEIIPLIRAHNLPRECIPTEHLNSPDVWEALLERMPLHAMVRNLAKMTAVGLLKPFSAAAMSVSDRLADADALRKSRMHPMALLLAAKTYSSGRGLKGSLSWEPVAAIVDALDAAFYAAFANVTPAGKRTLMGLDVSGSMAGLIGGTSLSCAEGAAAMAMVHAKTEPHYQLMAFADRMRPLDISGCSRLADVVRRTSDINFGGTDCSLPMILATEKRWEIDTFQVYTDSETWAGKIQPVQALRQYRSRFGIPSKLIVVGMASNGFTIADPSDAGMLDVVGFDASAPAVMADFSRS